MEASTDIDNVQNQSIAHQLHDPIITTALTLTADSSCLLCFQPRRHMLSCYADLLLCVVVNPNHHNVPNTRYRSRSRSVAASFCMRVRHLPLNNISGWVRSGRASGAMQYSQGIAQGDLMARGADKCSKPMINGRAPIVANSKTLLICRFVSLVRTQVLHCDSCLGSHRAASAALSRK